VLWFAIYYWYVVVVFTTTFVSHHSDRRRLLWFAWFVVNLAGAVGCGWEYE
jgi:hypothetical protein